MATMHSSPPMEGAVAPRRAGHVTERVVDGELVLYDPLRQFVHALNPTAALIWRACDGQRDATAIVAELADLYPESAPAIERDVQDTLELLASEGLLATD